MAKKQPLHCTFHNPNSAARTAEFLLRLFLEVGQKKNGSVWNAFSGEKHMGYRIAASTIARLPTITEKRQG